MSEKTIAGQVKCQDCGRSVELRINKGGRAYYRCDGAIAEEACNASHTYGPGPSKKVLAAAKAPVPVSPPPAFKAQSVSVKTPNTPGMTQLLPPPPPPPAPEQKDPWKW